jgi:hypothetical protein
VTANVQPQQSDDTDPNIKFIPIGYASVDGSGGLDQWTAVDQLSPLPVYFPSTFPLPAGTNQIGSVTASISSFATSVTARLINPAGTSVTYAEVGTAGSPSVDVLSVQGVTAGTPVITTLLLSSTAITSGSFSSLTSATLVPGNVARKMATVYNLGAGQLFINQGSSATTLGGGFMVALSSGDYFECGFTTTTLSAIFATAGTASWVSY